MAVVSISRQYGAGGVKLGMKLAERLGYQFVDRNLLGQVAEQANVSLKWVEEVEKEAGGLMARFVAEWARQHPHVRNIPDASTRFDETAYRAFLTRVISNLAAGDRVVFMGRGSQYILKNNPKAVRISLVASEQTRIANLMEHYSVDRAKAEHVVNKEEKRRLAFLCGFGEGKSEETACYHAVLNTGLVHQDDAVDFICKLVERIG
ncbi:conserved hypothetical protein [Desulfarculus baarsii DSM 2075]|uniref:Cytidylate kinase n=1 Tax=Desulfarculus baarsii (strain ATCC 33931 / DSM 2075 / LMG 7858 / VKM B-1802 / 2st14) TaxID=644282 RepID=E1QGX6_DESB2|nr:cytidylate kinase-like family protein [Desulfarculus baarsii]ADK84819.1 conserved hypothetical protein [Desulfarculus baarsii DSM 2075]